MNKVISLFLFVAIIAMSQFSRAETYYVDQNHPLASDNNPGTEAEPFETVQKGINSSGARDTVYIKAGIYDLAGFSKDLDQPIAILGQDKKLTVLDSIGTLNIIGTSNTDIFTLKEVKFTNYQGSIINLTVADGETLDGVTISNCIFDRVERLSKTRVILARYDVSPAGIITNINISNCDFLGLKAPGVKYIYIYEGIISDINISNNNFHDLISTSDTRGAVAVYIGTNSNLFVNREILISGNFMDTIVASSLGEIETHGILAYGDSMQIINNAVRYMVPGTDHEAIYMKGSYSLIANNVMINCTSKQGAIAIKGAGKSFHDTIRNNRVQSNQEGKSIYTAGPESITMEDNYIKNTYDSSLAGLYIYAANGSSCFMKNNYSQTAGDAAYMHDVGGGEITGNTLISYAAQTIDLSGTTTNIFIDGNLEYAGWPTDPPTAMAAADIVEGEAPLNVNFSSAGSIDPNGEIVSYEWNFHDGSISTDPNPSHIFTTARTYMATLIVTDADGFKDMAYVIIRVEKTDEIVAIDSKTYDIENLMLHIYPNPSISSANITFNLPGDSKVILNVYDMKGNIVKSLFNGNLNPGKHNMFWEGRDEKGKAMPSGIYIIHCRAGDYEQVRQVVFIRY